MPLSSDPQARERQIANLKRGQLAHGANSEALIRPLAEEYLAELAGEFPNASERVLRLQARRLAKLDRLGSYLEGKGEIRHHRRGEVFPASALEESITSAFLSTQAKLEAQHAANGGRPGNTLAQIEAELAGDGDGGDGDVG
jgi:hypothetical protein